MSSIKMLAASALFGAGLAAAQGFGLSQTCQSTLLGFIASPQISECFAFGDFLSVAALALADPTGNSTATSLVPAFGTWLKTMCGAPACSNDTLSTIVTDFAAGCNTDLNSQFGITIPPDPFDQIIPNTQSFYPDIREALCLKTNGSFCVSEGFMVIQTLLGKPIDLGTIEDGELSTTLSSAPPSLLCSDCFHSAFVLTKGILAQFGVSFDQQLTSVCGADFANGTISPDVQDGANPSTLNGNSTYCTQQCYSHWSHPVTAVATRAARPERASFSIRHDEAEQNCLNGRTGHFNAMTCMQS